MGTKSWSDRLRLVREARGVKRAQLARLAAVSTASLYSYEVGRRRPTRNTVDKILEVLNVESGEADLIRYELGFSTVWAPPVVRADSEVHRPEHVPWPEYLADVPWPQYVFNANEWAICGVNRAFQHLISWLFGSRRDLMRSCRPRSSMVALICTAQVDPHLPHIVNLVELLKYQVTYWKYLHGSDEPPWFEELLDRIALTDKIKQRGESLLAKFLQVWEETPPAPPTGMRYHRCVIGQTDLGYLEFWVQTIIIDERELLYFTNMVPANRQTWDWLDALPRAGRGYGDHPNHPPATLTHMAG